MRAVVVWGIIGLLCLGKESLFAQISRGGLPVDIISQKKGGREHVWYRTPVSAIGIQLKSADKDQDNEVAHKPLKCAFPFSISLSPSNSGEWKIQNNYRIWTLGIESEGALSIGLGFGKYKLPPGAKLYVFNENRTDIIGAFTEFNNKDFGKFTTMPVHGDKIFVQYEELIDSEFEGELEISRISHVYVDLKSVDPRRPLDLSGSCNINVNCEIAEEYSNVKNSICRIYIPKPKEDEVCTGMLINNTANNGKPYVITAAHCIENSTQAQESLFLFNYESPYCGSVDGDNTHSLEGSSLKARYDSLDFSLVELSVAPPDYFRPYYAGWDVSGDAPSRSFAIHHPQGDIKKIAVDENQPTTATYNRDYISSSFWKISRWEYGVTEAGSSGGPLFDNTLRVIGTLTGGIATCSNPVSDYYEKLSKSWNFKRTSDKQLKYWLDPANTDEKKINGYEPYSGELKCGAFTNFTFTDTTQLKRITETIPSNGYLTGTNKSGYTEFAEKFSGLKNGNLHGVSIGIAKKYIANATRDVIIGIKVYDGYDLPQNLLHSQNFVLNQLAAGAMNYLAFSQQVSTVGNFFVSCSVTLLNPGDTLALYQAKRTTADNSFFMKTTQGWKDYKTITGSTSGSALLMELIACNIDKSFYSPILKSGTNEIVVFPNPLSSGGKLTVQLSGKIRNSTDINIYNLLGQEIPFQIVSENTTNVQLQLRDARMGIYLLQIESDKKKYTAKISVVP